MRRRRDASQPTEPKRGREPSLAALRGRAALQRKEAALAHIIDEARAAQSQLESTKTELERIDSQLHGNDFAPDIQTKLVEVEAELAELGYG